MERKQLSISDRKAVEDGKLLVETRDGRPARVLCWDRRGDAPIVALVSSSNNPGDARLSPEGIAVVYPNGMNYYNILNENDLFLVPNPDYKEPTTTCSTSVDWDAFRREAAKDFTGVFLSKSELENIIHPEHRFSVIRLAVIYADELIKQLKEEKNGLH